MDNDPPGDAVPGPARPWETEPLRRSLLQGTLWVFAPSLLLHLLSYLQFTYLIGQRMKDTTWLTYEKGFFPGQPPDDHHFRACQYYLALDYGKLEVFLQPPAEEPVVISQKRGPVFKEWMQR